MIPLAVGMKAYLIYFLLRGELEVISVWILWKNQFSLSKFSGAWNYDLRTDLFNWFL